MNRELLLKVKETILQNPARANMSIWQSSFLEDPMLASYFKAANPSHAEIPPCGTVGCIAGWTLALYNRRFSLNYAMEAAGLLEITPEQASELFYVGGWPTDLLRKIAKHQPGTPEYAAVIGEAIDRFIGEYDHEH